MTTCFLNRASGATLGQSDPSLWTYRSNIVTQHEQGLSNADQRRYWNEKGGPIWVAKEDMYALQRAFTAHEGERLQVRVGLNAGEAVW